MASSHHPNGAGAEERVEHDARQCRSTAATGHKRSSFVDTHPSGWIAAHLFATWRRTHRTEAVNQRATTPRLTASGADCLRTGGEQGLLDQVLREGGKVGAA